MIRQFHHFHPGKIRQILFLMTILFWASETFAQAIDNSSISRSAVVNDVRYAEWQLNKLRQKQKPPSSFDPVATEQAQTDFKLLQIANNSLQKAVFLDSSIDSKYLKNLLSELKKRALNLKNNLHFPVNEKTKGVLPIQDQTLASSAKLLDNLVLRFVSNPVLKESKVINVENGMRAGLDLQQIILFSDDFKKQLDKLVFNEKQSKP